MTITVNAESETYAEESLTIKAILERKHWSFPLIIARVNGELVPRDGYEARRVVEGDALELYHLISGG
jgi:thiamine biosynthesis protein ThiS